MAVATLGGLLTAILTGLAASFVARLLLGAGLAFGIYNGIQGFADSAITQITATMGDLPADVGAVLALAGVGDMLDIILSTIAGTLAVVVGGRIVGIRVAG